MGLFFDLIQQSQISHQGERSDNLETRVHQLEAELRNLRLQHHELLVRLEKAVGEDINRDGRIG